MGRTLRQVRPFGPDFHGIRVVRESYFSSPPGARILRPNKCGGQGTVANCSDPPLKRPVARSGRMKMWISRGVAVLFAGMPVALCAQNQPVTSPEEIDQEIIVTAQKRATALQDVPFSVAAMSSDDLKQSGATN